MKFLKKYKIKNNKIFLSIKNGIPNQTKILHLILFSQQTLIHYLKAPKKEKIIN